MTDEDLVRELCDIESGLSDWEVEFVENVARRVLDEHLSLSPRQRETAEKIKEKRGGSSTDPDEDPE